MLMKRKLTRATIDEVRKEMPILTEEEMRFCSGGDSGTVSWNCLFNCMNAMDPSKSVQEYAQEYVDRYNLDPAAMGGVPENYISDVLSTLGFKNVLTDSMINDRGYEQVIIKRNPDGTAHAVIALTMPDEEGYIRCNDPTNNNVIRISKTDIVEIYRIKKSEIDTSVNSVEGEDVYGYNNSIFTNDCVNGYNQNYDYGNYGVGWNDYISNYSADNITSSDGFQQETTSYWWNTGE